MAWPDSWEVENTKVVTFEVQKRAGLELEVGVHYYTVHF